MTVEVEGLDWHYKLVDMKLSLAYTYLNWVNRVSYSEGYLIPHFTLKSALRVDANEGTS